MDSRTQFKRIREIAEAADHASVFSFTFPLATVTCAPRLGALAFCVSACVRPDRNLARKGSLSSKAVRS